MLRRIVSAAVVLGLCVGVAMAAEIRGVITKVSDGKVTFYSVKFDKDTKKVDKGEEQTLPVADNVKVVKSKFNKDTKKTEPGEALEGGLKNEMFTKIGEKGVGATIITDDASKKITEIRVGGGRGGKGKDKQ
jgi:hypothetical protein